MRRFIKFIERLVYLDFANIASTFANLPNRLM